MIDGTPALPEIPAQYDHAYAHPIFLAELPRDLITKSCRGASEWECAAPGPDGCNVFILSIGPGGVAPLTFLRLFLHARAHCNGWPADHPP